jgi:hypothetical protein
MPSKVYSAAVVGVEAFELEIEVHAGWGKHVKRAVEVAAAGGHNILTIGPIAREPL